MSVVFNTGAYTPAYKCVYALAPATTFTVWTPASGLRVNLTDLVISNAAAGTIALYYGSADGTVAQTKIMEFVTSGSAVIPFTFECPVSVPTPDHTIKAQSGMNGFVGITALGYES
jgi:hypothetical protein